MLGKKAIKCISQYLNKSKKSVHSASMVHLLFIPLKIHLTNLPPHCLQNQEHQKEILICTNSEQKQPREGSNWATALNQCVGNESVAFEVPKGLELGLNSV